MPAPVHNIIVFHGTGIDDPDGVAGSENVSQLDILGEWGSTTSTAKDVAPVCYPFNVSFGDEPFRMTGPGVCDNFQPTRINVCSRTKVLNRSLSLLGRFLCADLALGIKAVDSSITVESLRREFTHSSSDDTNLICHVL